MHRFEYLQPIEFGRFIYLFFSFIVVSIIIKTVRFIILIVRAATKVNAILSELFAVLSKAQHECDLQSYGQNANSLY